MKESPQFSDLFPDNFDFLKYDTDLLRYVRLLNQQGLKIVSYESFYQSEANLLVTGAKEILPYVSNRIAYVIKTFRITGVGATATALSRIQFYDSSNTLNYWEPWIIIANSNTPAYFTYPVSFTYRLAWNVNGMTGTGVYNYQLSGFKLTLNG